MSKKTIVKVILKTLYFRKVTNNVIEQKWNYLIQYKLKNKSPKSENRKFFCSHTFWGHLTHVYYTIHEILNKETYLTFTNSSE